MTKILKASNFPSRQHLEAHMQTLKKPFDYSIQGTTEELARLKLSHTTLVFGAQCIDITKQADVIHERPDRGPRFESGINIPVEKRKKVKKVTKKK